MCPQEEDEFSALAACLGLYTSVPQPSSMVTSASCLQWPVDASDLVTQWCAEVTTLSQIQAEQSLVCQAALSTFAALHNAEKAAVDFTVQTSVKISVKRFYNLKFFVENI